METLWEVRQMTRFVDGIVTSTSPLRVMLDGDTEAMPFAPDSLVDVEALSVDDRVRCEISGNRVVIHGIAGGASATETNKGVVELATETEALGGDDERALTGASIAQLVTLLNPAVIPDAADLDDYVTSGRFICTSSTHAANGDNYPVDVSGVLEVVFHENGSNDFFFQTYTVTGYSGEPALRGAVWRRWKFASNGWTVWKQQAQQGFDGMPYRMAAGKVAVAGGGSSSAPVFWSGLASVTFPASRFSQAPIVALTVAALAGSVSWAGSMDGDSAPTTSGCSIRTMRIGAAPSGNIHWQAVQMLEGAGAG